VIFAALSEAAERGELILVPDGMLRWHLRRDGVVVIREVIVLPLLRRTGIGKGMLRVVQAENPGRTVRARCPVGYESNAFWRAMGFDLITTEKGVNVWERRPST
jgi:hypothetical protein